MGKGLSPLQHDILAVLDGRRGWSRPKDILATLGREPTPSNRTESASTLRMGMGQAGAARVGPRLVPLAAAVYEKFRPAEKRDTMVINLRNFRRQAAM